MPHCEGHILHDDRAFIPGAPVVSVVMPVYNTERYVGEAVRSILSQIFTNLELIVVDDGSTDYSLQAIEHAAGDDPRVKIISQSNAGQSAARNRGLGQACGRFVYFMDSDDLLVPEAIGSCLELCNKENLDFVIFDGDVFRDGHQQEHRFRYHRPHCAPDKVYSGVELLETQLDHREYSPSPCLSFIRRDYLLNIGLHFMEGIIHEDELFSACLYLPAARVARIPRVFFHRRLRQGSIMTAAYSRRNVDGYLAVLGQMEEYAAQLDVRRRRALRRLMRGVLHGMMDKARSLPFGQRLSLFGTCLRRWPLLCAGRCSAVILVSAKRPVAPAQKGC